MAKVTNQSGLEPLGHALLCKPYEPELNSTKIVIPENVRENSRMREMRAILIAVGQDAWEGQSQRAEIGDKVLISKFAGVIVKGPLDNKIYRLCNDEDLFCKITAESWDEVAIEDPITKIRTELKAAGVKS
jgi:co-chaperonin GroES (HSP10)